MDGATKDFEELLKLFEARGARVVIVGAHAVAYHAKPRYTKDLEILIEPTQENAQRVLAALQDFGFGRLGLTVADFAKAGTIVQLGVAPNRVDLLTSIDGVSFEEVWDGRVKGKYGSAPAAFIGREELIRNKRASGRPQDLADLDWLKKS